MPAEWFTFLSFNPIVRYVRQIKDAEENLRVACTTALSSLTQLIALSENFSAALIQECMELNA